MEIEGYLPLSNPHNLNLELTSIGEGAPFHVWLVPELSTVKRKYK